MWRPAEPAEEDVSVISPHTSHNLAVDIADRLEEQIDSGNTQRYANRYRAALQALPDEPCEVCAGTGRRLPVPHVGAGRCKQLQSISGVGC